MKKALVATNLVEKVDIKTDVFIHFKHPVENQNLEFWEKKKTSLGSRTDARCPYDGSYTYC